MDDLRPLLAANAIDGTVVVQTVAEVGETREMLLLAAAEAQVAGVVGWVDLAAPDVADALAQHVGSAGGDALVGVRHQIGHEPPEWLCRSDVRLGLLALSRAGLVFDLLAFPRDRAAGLATARELPELRFVLNHAGKPPLDEAGFGAWEADMRAFGSMPHVAVKLSGLVTLAPGLRPSPATFRPYVRVLLEAYGPDRMMFGSDWPVCLRAASYSEVTELADDLLSELSDAERAQVAGSTAIRWYGIA